MKKLSLEDKRQFTKSTIIALIGLFLIVYSSMPFIYFFTSPIKSSTAATLVDIKLNNSVSDGGMNIFGKKFVYTLNWEFEQDGKKYNCTTTEKSSMSDAHAIGEKKMIFAYSQDGKNFKKVKLGVRTVGIPILGLLCIVFVIWDLVSYKRFKEDVEEEKSLYTIMSNTR